MGYLCHGHDPPSCSNPGGRCRGLSALMPADEGTHERLKAHLRELREPKINEHHCRTVEKIPATACWRNFRVLWRRRAARSKCGGDT